MSDTNTEWTNDKILREIYWRLLSVIHENAAAFENDVRKLLAGEELQGLSHSSMFAKLPEVKRNFESRLLRKDEGMGILYNIFVYRQLFILYDLNSYLDGAIRPIDWPGVELINSETRERLSIDFGFDFSEIEYNFITEMRKATPEPLD